MTWVISLLPLALSVVLVFLNVQINAYDMLTLFLPLIWGTLFSLGGAIIFINKYDLSGSPFEVRNKEMNKKIVTWSLILIAHILCFILLSSFYPLRSCINRINWDILKKTSYFYSFYKAFLFSSFMSTALGSVLVGGWCIYLASNKKHG